jgi:outer membrane biosynthesis protein TonB
MIKPIESPAAPTFTKGCAALWLIIALAFVALLLVPGAQARAAPAVASLAPAEGGSSTEGPAPGTEQAPPVDEEAPAPPAESTPAPEEAPVPPAESAPASEPAPAPPAESAPASEPAPAPPAESAPAPEQAPAPPQPPPPEQAPAPPAQSPPAPEEADSEGHSREGTGAGSQPASPAPEQGPAAETGPGVPIAPASSAAGPVTPEIAALPVAGQSLDMSWPVRIFMRSPGQVVCGLSGSVAPVTAGWLGTPGALPFPLAVLAAAGSSPAVLTDLEHGGRQRGDSGLQDHSSPAVPSFPPGGSSGSSAAGSGSGASCASTSALPGLHLHAAPSWMRRLHLAQPLWRTSSFVLIRERPD